MFLDTSALKAVYDVDDEHHPEASALMDSIKARTTEVSSFLTSDYVLDEAITLTRFALNHGKALELADAVLSSKFVRVVYVGKDVFASALEMFRQRDDKEWSFTDCVSFALMESEEVKAAFAFDPHFEQAGFGTMP